MRERGEETREEAEAWGLTALRIIRSSAWFSRLYPLFGDGLSSSLKIASQATCTPSSCRTSSPIADARRVYVGSSSK